MFVFVWCRRSGAGDPEVDSRTQGRNAQTEDPARGRGGPGGREGCVEVHPREGAHAQQPAD